MGATLDKAVENALRGELRAFFHLHGGRLIVVAIVLTAIVFGGLGWYAGALSSAGLPTLAATAALACVVAFISKGSSSRNAGAPPGLGQLPPHLAAFELPFGGDATAASLAYEAANLAYNVDEANHWTPFSSNELARGGDLGRVAFFRTDLRLVGAASRHFGLVGCSDDTAVVAFRGTDQEEGWLHNFDVRCEQLSAMDVDDFVYGDTDAERARCRVFLNALKKFMRDHPRAGVHRGFLDGVVRSLPHLWGPLAAWCAAHRTGRVIVAGHSLGGAMATVFAAGLRQHLDTERIDEAQVEVVTFGAPRAFTACAIKHVVAKMTVSRYVAQAASASAGGAALPHVADPVSMVPPPIAINGACDAYAHDGMEFKVLCDVGDGLLDGAVELISKVTMGTAIGLSGPLLQLHKMTTYARWGHESTKHTNSGDSRIQNLKSLLMSVAMPKPDALPTEKRAMDTQLGDSVAAALRYAVDTPVAWINPVQCFVKEAHWAAAADVAPAAIKSDWLVDTAAAKKNLEEAHRQAQLRASLVLAMGSLATVADSCKQTWDSARELIELRATTKKAEKTVASIKERLELNKERIEWVVGKFLPDKPRGDDSNAADEEAAAADPALAAALLEPDGAWVDDAAKWPNGQAPANTAFDHTDTLDTHISKLERRLNALERELDDVEVVVDGVATQLGAVRDRAAMAAAEAAVHTIVRSIEAITTRSPVAIAAAAAHGVTLLSAGAVAGTAHLTTGSVSQLAATIHECRKEIARQRGQLDRLRDASRRQAA